MTAPAVAARATGFSSGGTSHSIALPSGITTGDLLVIIFAAGSAASGAPAGWTSAGSFSGGSAPAVTVFYKVATVSNSATVLTGALTTSAHSCYRITGHSGSVAVNAATAGVGTSADPGAASLSGSKDYRFLAWTARTSYAAPSSYPTGYTDEISASDGRLALFSAERAITTSAHDPAAFSFVGSADWLAGVIVIEPQPVATCSPNNAAHSLASTSSAVKQRASATPASASHSHAAEQAAVGSVILAEAEDASHAHLAHSPTLAAAYIASPVDTSHGPSSSEPAMILIAPEDATHSAGANLPIIFSWAELIEPEAEDWDPLAAAPATIWSGLSAPTATSWGAL